MRRAEEEARHFQHGYVGTEHLLAGIAADTSSTGGLALGQAGIDHERVRETIAFIVGSGSASKPNEPSLTPRAKNVVQWAGDEARRRLHAEIETGHLLLALCAESEGLAMRIIESLGGSAESIIEAVDELMT